MDNYFWRGKIVTLRAMEPKDTQIWLKEDFDSDAVRFLNYGMQLPKTDKDATKFAQDYAYFQNSDRRIMFTILNEDSDIVGGMNIHTIDKKNGTFGIGSRIYREYRNRGYCEDAKRIILRYCFLELRMQKYNASCLSSNKAIISHFNKIGCKEEGRRRRNIYTDGSYQDEILFGLTKEEFIENDKHYSNDED